VSLTIFKSSAGSGKTYTLSKEYLKLSLRSPEYYQKILAVTFTNRAAEEMKERVLKFLIEISKRDHELIKTFAEELNISEDEVCKKANDTLTHILHNYSFFNITTIDTFFHRVIRSFSREIGLQGNFGIELDDSKVTDIISNDLYEGVEEDHKLRQWLIEFSMNRLEDGRGYESKNEIKSLANQLFSEEFKTISKTQIDDKELKEKIKDLQYQLFRLKQGFEKKLTNYSEAFFSHLLDNNLEVKDISYGKTGVAGFFIKLQNRKYDDLIGSRVESCLDNPESWSTKSNKKRDLVLKAAENDFIPLLNETVNYWNDNNKSYQTANAVLRNLFTFGLLSDLANRLQQYKKEEEVIMISDLPDFLNKIINDSDTPFIYEKVGNRYQHFFIDEFQDTSIFQWRNFKPLIQESLANGNENIIVGDAKQSIYRWRGGDPSLLMHQVAADIPSTLINDSNRINYRSASTIVDFNNLVFSRLPNLIQKLSSDKLSEAESQKVTTAYDGVNQQVASKNKDEVGLVQFEFLKKEKEEKYHELAMVRMVQLIEELYHQGHQLNQMAILVRRNFEAELIVNHLLEYKQSTGSDIGVISAEGMLLKNSPIVRLLLTTFKYLLYPEDSVIEKELILRYQQTVLGRKIALHEDFVKLDHTFLPASFRKFQQHFLHLPIFELTEVLIRLFRLNELEQDISYLQAFQDVVLEFSKKNRSDIRKFLEWWKDEENKRSVQLIGALNAVEIITSHKSKGLQYPIVFIPFCNFEMDSKTHVSWYETPNLDPFGMVTQAPVSYSSSLSETYFSDIYMSELADTYLESLNILYVAMTRAESGLFVLAPKPSENTRNWLSDVSKPLWKFFTESEGLDGWNDATGIYKVGQLIPKLKSKKTNVIELEAYPSYKWSSRISIRKTGKAFFDELVAEKVNEGILLHQILSEIINYRDTHTVLDRYEHRLEISREDRNRYEKLIVKLWEIEKVRSWFDDSGEVKTEVVVLPKDGEVKRIDRVIINGKEATVIDFKSGEPKSGDEKQLKEYIKLLEEMGYRTEGYLLYLQNKSMIKKI